MAKVIIFSGAGISAESGISTFRDADGLWENYKIEDICTAGCLEWNYQETIDFYDKRREDICEKNPNKAHLEIKKLQDKYPNEIKIITQNVDDMFEKAGCTGVLHLHGFLKKIICEKCGFEDDIGYDKLQDAYNNCPECENKLRPNIVFFGEAAPKYQDLYKELTDCEVFVVIGTSGNVINTDVFLTNDIKLSVLNNLEPSLAIDDARYTRVFYKKATEAIDKIVEAVQDYLSLKS